MADPKDGFSRGDEGCTEVEEVEVGRIDRMDVLALAAALPTRALLKCGKVSDSLRKGLRKGDWKANTFSDD